MARFARCVENVLLKSPAFEARKRFFTYEQGFVHHGSVRVMDRSHIDIKKTNKIKGSRVVQDGGERIIHILVVELPSYFPSVLPCFTA